MRKNVWVALVAWGIVGAANASLVDRGHGLIYDDVLNVTWLQDANLAKANTFGVSLFSVYGQMNYQQALAWVSAMNAASYKGFSDWRLPYAQPVGNSYNWGSYPDGTTDIGYNLSSQNSELAHLFRMGLGNTSSVLPSGALDLTGGLVNRAPFQNLEAGWYWTSTDFLPLSGGYNVAFDMATGYQGAYNNSSTIYAMVLRDGDVLASVPEPASWLLALSGLLLVGMNRHRKQAAR